ncbi:MAG: general secretion pathway protein GspK [Alphaproteobacteria bacterium]|nr:general secretion pathway protein GspK [Alphaproteobacteria bacterium]MBV9693938.1 general secretion pathway protein GspK [Alphaproteobacteria bacterium]
MRSRGDSGFAMIAALVAVAAFGFISFQLIAQDRGVLAEVRGEAEQAKLTAACNAGLMLAIAGLANPDLTQRWGIDGRSRSGSFNGYALTVTVEDERGKIPLNGIIMDEARQLFQIAGASGDQLKTLIDSFEDWEDVDNTPRPNGAEAPQYASLGYKPRNAGFHTVEELHMIKGMTDDIYNRVAPAVTVFFGESGGFSEQTSQIVALEVLGEMGANSMQVQQRQQQLAGTVAMPASLTKANLIGRTLTVRVEARQGGAYMKRSAIVELTGNPADPYWLRYLD